MRLKQFGHSTRRPSRSYAAETFSGCGTDTDARAADRVRCAESASADGREAAKAPRSLPRAASRLADDDEAEGLVGQRKLLADRTVTGSAVYRVVP
jgi:hypothetical protein